MKDFSKVDVKQNNVSTLILLIMLLYYRRDLRNLQGSRVVYIFVYITKSLFYLTRPKPVEHGYVFSMAVRTIWEWLKLVPF